MRYIVFFKILVIVFFIAGCETKSSGNKTVSSSTTDTNTTNISFSITAVTDANISTETSSGNISISGISGSVDVTLSSGTLVLNGVDLNETSTSITADDNISIKLTSSDLYGTLVSANLTVGSVTSVFSVTTMTNQPDAFLFTSKTGAERNTYYDSDVITISGLVSGSELNATLNNGVLIKNNVPLTDLNTLVKNDDNITIRLRSSESYSATVSSILTIASISSGYSITTESEPVASISIVMDDNGADAHYDEPNDVDSIVDVALNTAGTKAYMANSSGVLIADINSSSSNSNYMKTLDSIEINTTKKVAITSDGGRLFVASGYDGLVELNVTDSSNITELASYNSDYNTSSKYAWSVSLSGDEDIAYVANCAGVDVFDVSNLSAITRLDELNISGGNCDETGGIWLDRFKYDIVVEKGEQKAYLAYGDQGVKTLNLLVPSNIELNATYSDSTCTDARGIDLSTDGNTIVVACGTKGVHIVDVSDPTEPVKLSTYTLTTTGAKADHVKFSKNGNTLYVTHGKGLDIVDVSNTGSPSLITTYESMGNAYATAPDNNGTYFYLGDGTNGLLKLQLN